MAVPLEQPLTVVALDERADHLARFFERLEVMQVEALPFQRSDPPLDDAVALGLADERRGGADAQPSELAGELVCRVLRAPVVSQPEPQGDLRCVAEELLARSMRIV